MNKNTLLFCNGLSGSGKTYFIQNTLPAGLFYNLRSATTRPMRDGESEGCPYFFRDENYFDTARLATRLWVNEKIWTPGAPKWLYGIPESEIMAHLGENLIYDVIEPRYSRQLIDWFQKNNLARHYNFRVAYFLSPEQNLETARARANMPDDATVRRTNTCDPIDFLNAGIDPDYILMPRCGLYNSRLAAHINRLQTQR
jgi:guanylate kinase